MAKKKSSSAKAATAPLPESSSRKPRQSKMPTPPSDASQSSDNPVFFWKDDEDNGFLCQWYRCTFSDPDLEGLTFNCAEQYMMYRKAMLFNDTAVAAKIMKCTSPRKQKALGREIGNYDETKWCQERSSIVRRGNILKFSQCTNVASLKMDEVGEPVPLKELLLATGQRELAEASPFDAVWGIGLKAEEALTVSRSRWGENLLGKVLMEVRRELRGMKSTVPQEIESLETLLWLVIRKEIAREIWERWLDIGQNCEGLRGQGANLGEFARDFLDNNRFGFFDIGEPETNWTQHLWKLGASAGLVDAIANCEPKSDGIRLQQTAAQWFDLAMKFRWEWLLCIEKRGGIASDSHDGIGSTIDEVLEHTYDRSRNIVVDAQHRSLDYIPLWRCTSRVRAENLRTRTGKFSLRNQHCSGLFGLWRAQHWTPDLEFTQLYAKYVKKVVHPAPICLIRMELPRSLISKYTAKELRYPSEEFKRTLFYCRRCETIQPKVSQREIYAANLLIGDMSTGLNDNLPRTGQKYPKSISFDLIAARLPRSMSSRTIRPKTICLSR